MNYAIFRAGFVSALALSASPIFAQETDIESPANPTETVVEEPTAAADNAGAPAQAVQTAIDVPVASPVSPVSTPPAPPKPCELRVWPTENYIGVKMGLLSGFGAIGAVLDAEGNKDEVKSVKDLMREFLGPQVQMQELEKLNYLEKLGLAADRYDVIIEEPTPFFEEVKKDKARKAEVKAFNKKLKGTQRLTDSSKDCYAELVTTHIFYHKAMMYGSNLFTGWNYREFDGDKVTARGKGQVKNPLEDFPPKEAEMVPAAKEELRLAYSKDFTEWSEKKLKR